LSQYGIGELGDALGMPDNLSNIAGSVIGSGIGNAFGDGAVTGQEVVTTLNEAITDTAIYYGIDTLTQEITDDTLLQALTRRGLAGAFEGLMNPDEDIFTGMYDAYRQSLTGFFGLTPQDVILRAIDFGVLTAEVGLGEAFERYASNIFDRGTLESVYRTGGFITALASPKTDVALPDGTITNGVTLSDGTTVLFNRDNPTEFIGLKRGNTYQMGSFGIMPNGAFGLKEGTAYNVTADGSYYRQEIKGAFTTKSALYTPREDGSFEGILYAERTLQEDGSFKYSADLTGDGVLDVELVQNGEELRSLKGNLYLLTNAEPITLQNGTVFPADYLKDVQITVTKGEENQYVTSIQLKNTSLIEEYGQFNTNPLDDATEFTPALSLFDENKEGIVRNLADLFSEHADYVSTTPESYSKGIDALKRIGNMGKVLFDILAADKITEWFGENSQVEFNLDDLLPESPDITLYSHERTTFRKIGEIIDRELNGPDVQIFTEDEDYDNNDGFKFKFERNVITKNEAETLNGKLEDLSDLISLSNIAAVLAGYLRSQPYDGTQTDYRVEFEYQFDDGTKRRFELKFRTGTFVDPSAPEGQKVKTGVVSAKLLIYEYDQYGRFDIVPYEDEKAPL